MAAARATCCKAAGTSAGRRPVGVAAAVIGLLIVLYLADTNPIVNAAEVARNYVAEASSASATARWRPNARERGLIDQATRAARVHLVVDFQAELKQRDAEAGWTMAQELTALHGENRAADDGALALMNATHLPGTSACWPGICRRRLPAMPARPRGRFIPLGGLGLPADPSSLESLLEAQSQDGWWPMYFKVGGDNAYASTYATAWALMRSDQRPVPLRLAPIATEKLAAARAKAINWLISSQDPHQHRWKDYPYNSAGEASDGVSALAIVALNQSPSDPRVAAVNRAWLSHVPIFPGKIDGIERSNVALGASWKWDRTSYVVTPWVALSAYLALHDGTAFGRAQGLT